MIPKFRGKRKDNGEWVVGVPIPNSFCNVVHMIPILLTDKVAYPPERLHEYLIEIVPETLGQSTGLKDFNDPEEEIFKGDIFIEGFCVYVVYWNEEKAIFQLEPHGGGFSLSMSARKSMTLSGNIYENLELLEQSNES